MESQSPLTALLCALLRSPTAGLCGSSFQSRSLMLRDVAVRELNAFLWLSLIAVTALLSARVLKILRPWRNARQIAGPPSRGRLTEILSDSHEKYGSVVKLWLGTTRLLVSIKDPKLIKSLMFKVADKLPSITTAYNSPFGRSGLFASSFNGIYTEISTAKKDSKTPASQNVCKTPVFEAARFLAGPLLQRCSLHHDLNFEGDVIVPAGAVVVVPVALVEKDDSSWGNDAFEFNPHRFLSISDDKTELDENSFVLNEPSNNAVFLPFGPRMRACVGQSFIVQGVAEILTPLLNHLEIKLRQSNQEPKTNEFRSELLPSMEMAFI